MRTQADAEDQGDEDHGPGGVSHGAQEACLEARIARLGCGYRRVRHLAFRDKPVDRPTRRAAPICQLVDYAVLKHSYPIRWAQGVRGCRVLDVSLDETAQQVPEVRTDRSIHAHHGTVQIQFRERNVRDLFVFLHAHQIAEHVQPGDSFVLLVVVALAPVDV